VQPASAARRRPDRSRGDVREARLLEIAEALLREGRFEQTSIAEIAAAAEISRPTFYFYFASKQALLERLIESTLDELIGVHWTRIRQQNQPTATELRATLHDVADMWVEHGVVLAAAVELAGTVPALFERIAGVIESVVDSRAELLVQAGSTPEVADLTTARETARALLWMSERNFYVVARGNPSPEAFHALADRLFAIWARTAGISP
jgi:TetR/AcrR family transcriptional regulator, ethionamide resistance regulator